MWLRLSGAGTFRNDTGCIRRSMLSCRGDEKALCLVVPICQGDVLGRPVETIKTVAFLPQRGSQCCALSSRPIKVKTSRLQLPLTRPSSTRARAGLILRTSLSGPFQVECFDQARLISDGSTVATAMNSITFPRTVHLELLRSGTMIASCFLLRTNDKISGF
ncbi:hypothetical protein HYDPIDRAFT_107585 [Hydnomerulius pinastri MD-312]|nr:hypothetical protein HYDPIDRAFT_107585 [Hydnomerulius pinastri MD-312]